MNISEQSQASSANESCYLESINSHGTSTIVEVFERACELYADKPAFTSLRRTLDYAELERLSAYFASYLQQSGLNPGDRIAVQLPNLVQYPVVVFGALRAGLVVVNTNPLACKIGRAHV